MSRRLSRRAFLIASGAAIAGGLTLPRTAQVRGASSQQNTITGLTDLERDFIQPREAKLELWGRITEYGTPVRGAAGLGNEVVAWLPRNQVVPLLEVIDAEGSNANNRTWYRITEGFLYTTTVQAMYPYRMPEEVTEITTTIVDLKDNEQPGFWGEIVVPYTVARSTASGAAAILEDGEPVVHYYGSVHRVTEVEFDAAGFLWYKVADDKPQTEPVYVLARHMRQIPPEELAPISPGANKRLEVDLVGQRISAYEDDTLVFTTLTSSGGAGFDTPAGEHAVVFKQQSRHMYSDPENEAFSDPNYFDLPGVPFNIFFTTLGHAIHGTYWHGDYGRPRSHGCLNVTPEAARWLFRWVEPFAPYENMASGSSADPGTPIIVSNG